MIPHEHLWIPVTLFAAFAQTIRNATQRNLTASLGTLGATLVRFLYGIPFAVLWLVLVQRLGGFALPDPNWRFAGWIVLGAIGQIGGTALLLQVMRERNFTLGVAYSKTEAIQVAFFGFIFLADPLRPAALLAVFFGTLGVLLMSPIERKHPLKALLGGWTTRVALFGLACGTCFSFASVGYRGASLALEGTPFPMTAAYGLVVAQVIQTLVLGGWLASRDAGTIVRVVRAWRASLLVGFVGAVASAGWFVAMAIEPIAHVRTLALVELLFAYVISRRFFRERLTRIESIGIGLLCVGLITVTLGR
ncbi:MAG: EamA/RhaT family transporter [Burkholderiales bacterium]|nr:EamA/RhaT family transporter [Burkholderiales bacterium]